MEDARSDYDGAWKETPGSGPGQAEDIIEAAIGRSKILENYPDELRCLILGSFHLSEKVTSPLHIVCDYSKEKLVDMTAVSGGAKMLE
ncbi:MAG: hypothetical protein HYY20_00940 [Candidatus Tectomicrobia bacterium]|uniref:Uncharacterized protein n=1 Tax=Tectimicrobiota bacterium TaxID=2528274 RepID=A0A932FVM6_UNCTE|nr:hypothetical protein [Candidatus Tectomicrobia bacterium]